MVIMRLLSDVFVKFVIYDRSFNIHVSLAHVRSWCRAHFIFVDLVVFPFFLFHNWAKPLKVNIPYNFIEKLICCLITLKSGYKDKWKFMVQTYPNSCLDTFRTLDSLFAENFSGALSLNNRILNAVDVVQTHNPIIQFSFSYMRITLFAPAYLMDT